MSRIRTIEPNLASRHLGTFSSDFGAPQIFITGPQTVTKAYCFDRLHAGPPYRDGGPLALLKNHLVVSGDASKTLKGLNTRLYVGGFVTSDNAAIMSANFPNYLAQKSGTEMELLGTKGWNRAHPTKTGAHTFENIVEGVQRFPHVPGFNFGRRAGTWVERIRKDVLTLKGAGSEYLNWNFGWKPLLNEVRALLRVSEELPKQLERARRNSNRLVKRNIRLELKRDNGTYFSGPVNFLCYPGLPAEFYGPAGGFVNYRWTSVSHIYFKGSFKIWVPDLGSSQWSRRAKRTIYGLDVTPSLVWEVTPWSWLIDYFGNVGSILSNIGWQIADSFIADHAYVMSSLSQVDTWEQSQQHWSKGEGPSMTHTKTELTRSVKQRHEANPYGFGFDMGGLSPFQASILAALTASRR